MPRIAILDYGMGNLRSAEKALERVGVDVVRTSDADQAAGADGLVLPGVGAFPEAMRRIRSLGFDDLVRDSVAGGTPLIGICLGMQLLFEESDEHEGAEGLGLVDGSVTRLDVPGLKVPHIGWEAVRWTGEDDPLQAGIPSGSAFYFVHSFAPKALGPATIGVSDFGPLEFTSVVSAPPVWGAQFHPEKSSTAGLRMLENFSGICDRAAIAA